MKKLEGSDIFLAHRVLRAGAYRSEEEIWQREADLLNSILERKIDIGKIAREVARKRAPKPPATRKIEDKRRKPAKHRKPLTED